MEYNSIITASLLLLPGIGLILLLLERGLGPQHGRDEPPIVSSRIPFIGHLLGLFTHGTQYFSTMR